MEQALDPEPMPRAESVKETGSAVMPILTKQGPSGVQSYAVDEERPELGQQELLEDAVLDETANRSMPLRSPRYHRVGRVAFMGLWPSPSIEVCWEQSAAGRTMERQWVRAAVETTWERVSGLDFQYWGDCNERSQGIRIGIDDTGAGPSCGFGRKINGVRNGMKLNFDFTWWCGLRCSIRRKRSIRIIAVHQFGHALGFGHNHRRDDTPDTCPGRTLAHDQVGHVPADFQIAPWDRGSVMNYCALRYNNNGRLTGRDIAGVRMLYGLPGLTTVQYPIQRSYTPRNTDAGRSKRAVIYLDRHNVHCPSGQLLKELHLYRPTRTTIAYRYRCVKIPGLGPVGTRYTRWRRARRNWSLKRHAPECPDGQALSALRVQTRRRRIPIWPDKWYIRYRYQCRRLGLNFRSGARRVSTPWNNPGRGKLMYLDRHHLQCSDGEVMTQLRLESRGNSDIRYSYRCKAAYTA